VAYCLYLGADLGGLRPAIYAYCPNSSSDRASWSFVALGDNVQDARLALDPQGRPRLLLFGPAGDPEAPDRMRYQDAERNGRWTNPSNWTISPQGTVALIHTEKVDYDSEHPVYVSCAGAAGRDAPCRRFQM
jgi:hypothetical protein